MNEITWIALERLLSAEWEHYGRLGRRRPLGKLTDQDCEEMVASCVNPLIQTTRPPGTILMPGDFLDD